MNKLVMIMGLLAALISSGCLSAMSYKASLDEWNAMQPEQAQDDVAIKAVEIEDGAGIGLDFFNLEALKLNTGRQILAAVGDAVIIYGGYKIEQKINGSSGGGGSQRNVHINISNSDNANVSVSGDSQSQSSSSSSTRSDSTTTN